MPRRLPPRWSRRRCEARILGDCFLRVMNLVVRKVGDEIDARFLERSVNNRSVFLFHGSLSFSDAFSISPAGHFCQRETLHLFQVAKLERQSLMTVARRNQSSRTQPTNRENLTALTAKCYGWFENSIRTCGFKSFNRSAPLTRS